MESQTIRFCILEVMDDKTVTTLSFSREQRKRIRHSGEIRYVGTKTILESWNWFTDG